MSWRYQPVINEDESGQAITLVEVHFDDAGNFKAWAEGDAIPMGEDAEALTDDLHRMLVDAMCWVPVSRRELKPGMKFIPRVSMEGRRGVADFIQHSADAMKRQPKPITN